METTLPMVGNHSSSHLSWTSLGDDGTPLGSWKSASMSKTDSTNWYMRSSMLLTKTIAMEEYRMSGTAWKLSTTATPPKSTHSVTTYWPAAMSIRKALCTRNDSASITTASVNSCIAWETSEARAVAMNVTWIHFMQLTLQVVRFHGDEGTSVTGSAFGSISWTSRKIVNICKAPSSRLPIPTARMDTDRLPAMLASSRATTAKKFHMFLDSSRRLPLLRQDAEAASDLEGLVAPRSPELLPSLLCDHHVWRQYQIPTTTPTTPQ
mmetsp:Transcript_75434/g.196686  ORF Transcript_75434/g.196686 Transcript_75434/m.196686 type:complete len:265 (-) Transcript_75434:80-874(-)